LGTGSIDSGSRLRAAQRRALRVAKRKLRHSGEIRWVAFVALTVALATLAPAAGLGAAPSADSELLLGMSTALSGPAAELGENMRAGVLAALDEANRAGGIGGRSLRLVSLDDQYEPAQTVPNMRALIDDHAAVAIVGNVGTPTAVAAIPIANESKAPFFGAFTGAGVLRKTPPDRYVINYRASYAEETAAMVDALVEKAGLKVNEIAFFTQRDAYGDAGFVGGITALRRHGLASEHDVAHGRYERNTLAVENGLAEILQADPMPRAVIMVGAYAPCARFIELTRDLAPDILFLNVSFVGAAPLSKALGDKGEGVIVTQVVPHIDADIPVVAEYREALSAMDGSAGPTFGSLEGYVATRILLQALRSSSGLVTRESVVDSLEGLGNFDIGLGVPLHLGPDDHQASHTVWPTILRGGRIEPLEWAELGGGTGAAKR
jgi:ABC-type branched-subunit amino acid transport system substrate-binding protein